MLEKRQLPFIKQEGMIFRIFLLLYSISRFIVEIFRGDDRGYVILNLSTTQIISLIIIIVASFSIVFSYKKLDQRFLGL